MLSTVPKHSQQGHIVAQLLLLTKPENQKYRFNKEAPAYG